MAVQELPEAWCRLDRQLSVLSSQVMQRVSLREREGECVYPPAEKRFNAFYCTAPHDVKVVILGQDPYHGYGQGNGLAFSVEADQRIPPSLRNIFKELEADLGLEPFNNGDLTQWAQQGVLLLNNTLTVPEACPNGHSTLGWDDFTDQVIKALSDQLPFAVFVLWGKFAQGKSSLIDTQKHALLMSAHPSPFSAHRGFLGSRVFSEINRALESHQKTPITWGRRKMMDSLF